MWRNIEKRSCKPLIYAVEKQKILHVVSVCLRHWLSNTQTFVPYWIVVCGLSDSKISLPIVTKTTRNSGKMLLNTKCVFWFYLRRYWTQNMCFDFVYNVTEHKMCVLILSTTLLNTKCAFWFYLQRYWTQNVRFDFIYNVTEHKMCVLILSTT